MPDPDHSVGEIRECFRKNNEYYITVVIFVDRSKNEEESIRIVSARKATKFEENQYDSNDIK
ncbi:BrnT family toxin [Leptospira sp. WS58.C1]|uniref:BrnT family toxin n=1 Tax=Leptospira cinconiae TaxID=3235173 RepID=UPI00349E7349